MRILLVNDYGTMAGRAEVIVLSLRDALRSRGHEVRVLTSDASERADPLFAEAQMQGVAAIVSEADGLAEIVDDGVTGWTVPPGDVATLADRLGQALGSDRSLVRSLGDAGHAMARERFGLDGFADRFEAVYRSMVSAPTREVPA
jgi:glycosyltransferase involved in cell wall biosynthesis